MGEVSVEAMQSIELKVGSSTIRIDQTGVSISGTLINISGDASVSIDAPMTSVSGDATVSIQGGMVEINAGVALAKLHGPVVAESVICSSLPTFSVPVVSDQ